MRTIARKTVFGLIALPARVAAATLIRRRMRESDRTRIILGAGRTRRKGWIATDIELRDPHTIYLDVTRRFPLPDASVDAYLSVHMVEHLRYEDVDRMLAEIRRTLKPEGWIRIATPNLAVMVDLMRSSEEAARYIEAANRGWARYWRRGSTSPLVPSEEITAPAFTVNRCFRAFGHDRGFIYDADTLGSLLARNDLTWRRVEFGDLELRERGRDAVDRFET